MVVVGPAHRQAGHSIGFTRWRWFFLEPRVDGDRAGGVSLTKLCFLPRSRTGGSGGSLPSFPPALRPVAEWFPKKETAPLATGIFNAGTSIGANAHAGRSAPGSTARWGWRGAFHWNRCAGFRLARVLAFNLWQTRKEHPHVSKAELDYIRRRSASAGGGGK